MNIETKPRERDICLCQNSYGYISQGNTWADPMVLTAPKIRIYGTGERVSIEEAEAFVAEVQKAIAIARDWDKDTGQELTKDE